MDVCKVNGESECARERERGGGRERGRETFIWEMIHIALVVFCSQKVHFNIISYFVFVSYTFTFFN